MEHRSLALMQAFVGVSRSVSAFGSPGAAKTLFMESVANSSAPGFSALSPQFVGSPLCALPQQLSLARQRLPLVACRESSAPRLSRTTQRIYDIPKTERPPPPLHFPSAITWLFSLFYRTLLVGSIGLGFSGVAMAKTSTPTLLQVVEKNAIKYFEEIAKSTTQKSHANKETVSADKVNGLGAEFWNSLGAPKGTLEEALRKFLEENPTNVSALEVLLHSLLLKEDMLNALSVIQKLGQLEPEEMEWKCMKAEVYAANGEIEQAKEEFEDVLKVEPSSVRALQGLLIVMDEVGDATSALKMVEACIDKAKADGNRDEERDLRMLFGQFHCLKGEAEEALKIYQALMEEDPKDFRPYLCQGLIYGALEEKEKAEGMFKMYRELRPKDFPDKEHVEDLIHRSTRGEKLFDVEGLEEDEQSSKSLDEPFEQSAGNSRSFDDFEQSRGMPKSIDEESKQSMDKAKSCEELSKH